MYKLNTNNTTYIVPLDGLDLSCLNRSYGNRGRPLWSLPSGEEYYEFKLNAWRVPEESDRDDEEITGLPSETQICHICNTHVPITYIKDHNNSVKHINMKKIHDLIVIRGQNPDLKFSEEHAMPETNYYCEECSMVLLKRNKRSHEASYTHKKSLRNKDLIEQFLKFYSQDLNEDGNKTKTSLKEYFNKFLNRKNLFFKVDVVDDENILIIIRDHEYKVKVHSNNFHGFVKMDGDLICILCEIQLRGKGIDSHVESKKHRKKITRNIDDQHCIREINEDFGHCLLCNELVLLTRVAGHKILSYHILNLNQALGSKSRSDFNKNVITLKEIGNSVFGNLSDELQSDDQESGDEVYDGESNDGCESKELSSEIKIGNETQTTNQTYCNVCSIYIDKHNFKNHKMGSVHKQLESSKINADQKSQQKINDYVYKEMMAQLGDISKISAPLTQYATKNLVDQPSGATKDKKSLNIHYHMEESSYNIVSCRVCNLKMYIEDMNDHINQNSHINKYENLLKINKINKKNDYICNCQVCDESVLLKRELDHIYSEQHRNNICNDETNLYQVKNENENETYATTNQKDDTTESLADGVRQDENYNQTHAEDTVPDDFVEKISYQILETAKVNEIICKVCNLKMSNEDLEIFKHFDGDEHALKYSELLKINRLTKAQNKFFCYTCKTSITNKNELEHIFGNKHKSKFPHHEIDAACKISCQINEGHISVTVQSTDIHEKATAQTSNAIKTSHVKEAQLTDLKTKNDDNIEKIDNAQAVFHKEYYLVTKTKNPSEVICQVCNIILTNSIINIESHMLGSDHKNRYESTLKVNGIKIKETGFYCEACKVSLTNKNELIHINGCRHQSNVLSYAISCLQAMCNVINQSITTETVEQANNTHISTSEEVQPSLVETKKNSKESENVHPATETVQASYSKPHYHVTETENPNEVLCKICNVLLSNSTVNIETHIIGLNHTSKYKNLMDSNGLKKEDNRHFCGLCKAFVPNKNELEHIMGFRHKANLPKDDETYIQPSVDENEATEESKEQTDDDDLEFPDSSFDQPSLAKREIENLDVSENEHQTIKTVQASFSKPYYHVAETENPNEVLCKICNVILLNSTVNIETHIIGFNHTSKYKNLIDSNYLKKENNKYFCKLCKVFVTNKNEIEHIMGFRHKANVPKVNENNIQPSVNEMEATEESIAQTVDDVVSSNENDGIDQRCVADNEVDYSDESENDKQLSKTMNVQSSFSQPHYHFSETENQNEVLCKICNVILSNSTVNIETHIIGFNHTSNYENLIDSNGLKKENNMYFCEMCKVFVPNKNEIEHIMGFRHKANVPKNNTKNIEPSVDDENETTEESIDETGHDDVEYSDYSFEISDYDDEFVQPYIAETEVEYSDESDNENPSENTQPATETANVQTYFPQPHYHVTETTNPSKVLCKICNVILTNSAVNIQSHINGSKHANKYKILLDSNGLKKEKDSYFCEKCSVFVSNKNEIQHIMGVKHRKNIEQS